MPGCRCRCPGRRQVVPTRQQPEWPGRPQRGGIYGEKQQGRLDGVTGIFYPRLPRVMLLKCTFCKVKTNHKQQKSGGFFFWGGGGEQKLRSWQKDKGRQLKCSLKLRGSICLSKWPHLLWRLPDALKCLVRQSLSSCLILAKFMDPDIFSGNGKEGATPF